MGRRKKLITTPQVELRGRVAITMKDRVDELYANVPHYKSWNQCFHDVVLAGLGVMENLEAKNAAEKKAKHADKLARCDDATLADTVEPVKAPKEKVEDMMPEPKDLDEEDFEIPAEVVK